MFRDFEGIGGFVDSELSVRTDPADRDPKSENPD